MSSDDFDVVIEAMLEAPFKKKEKQLVQKAKVAENANRLPGGVWAPDTALTASPAAAHSGSSDESAGTERSPSHDRRHGSERGRGRRHHKGRRRSHERRRRGRRRGHGGRRSPGRRHRRRRYRSSSRSPNRSRSLSRDRLYGRTAEERDACTILCLQFSGRTRPRDLGHFFSPVGKVRDVKIISDRSSRRSKGIAYVEFYSIESVSKAIALSGTKLLDVPIIIQAAQAEKNRAEAGGGQRGTPGPQRLYVGSLHSNITQDMLRDIFTPFGKIESLHLIRDPDTGISKGYGFVTFAESDCARRVLEQLNGFEVAGRPLRVGPVAERWEPEPTASLMDSDDTDRCGVSLGPSGRLQLMARLAEGAGMNLPPAVLQLRNIYPFGILMPAAAGLTGAGPSSDPLATQTPS